MPKKLQPRRESWKEDLVFNGVLGLQKGNRLVEFSRKLEKIIYRGEFERFN